MDPEDTMWHKINDVAHVHVVTQRQIGLWECKCSPSTGRSTLSLVRHLIEAGINKGMKP